MISSVTSNEIYKLLRNMLNRKWINFKVTALPVVKNEKTFNKEEMKAVSQLLKMKIVIFMSKVL